MVPEGCSVYEDRPTACRYYPVALLSMRRQDEATARDIDLDVVFGLELAAPVTDPDVPHPRALARDFVVVPTLEALGRAGREAPHALVEAARRLAFGARLLPQAPSPR